MLYIDIMNRKLIIDVSTYWWYLPQKLLLALVISKKRPKVKEILRICLKNFSEFRPLDYLVYRHVTQPEEVTVTYKSSVNPEDVNTVIETTIKKLVNRRIFMNMYRTLEITIQDND